MLLTLCLSYKVKNLGYKIACINDYKTYHYHKLTAKHFSKWKDDLVHRNQLLFIKNNFSGKNYAVSLTMFLLSAVNYFFTSFIRRDQDKLKKGISKINAFSYIKKPPIIPKG